MSTTNILDLNNRVDELEKSYPADKVMMSDGETSVEDAVDNVFTATNATGVSGSFHYTKIGRVVVGAGEMSVTENINAYSPLVTDLPLSEATVMGAFVAQDNGYNTVYINTGTTASNITTRTARNSGELIRLLCVYLAQS